MSSTWRKLYDQFRLEELILVRLYRTLWPDSNAGRPIVSTEDFSVLLTALVHELKQTAHQRGSKLVITWIPSYPDYLSESPGHQFRSMLKKAALDQLVSLIDLTDEFSSELEKQHSELLIIRQAPNAPELFGHYNAYGNKLIADILSRRLVEIPELAVLL